MISALRNLQPQLGLRHKPDTGSCRDDVFSALVAKCNTPVPERIQRNSSHSNDSCVLGLRFRGKWVASSSAGSSELDDADASPLGLPRGVNKVGGFDLAEESGCSRIESDIAKGNLAVLSSWADFRKVILEMQESLLLNRYTAPSTLGSGWYPP